MTDSMPENNDPTPEIRVAFALHVWTCPTCAYIDPNLPFEEKLKHIDEAERVQANFLVGFLGLKEETQ